MKTKLSAPDLAQHPPRSPRVRLGGYALLPRALDKCRAMLAGTQGEYKFNCPLDQRFFTFAGLDAEAFKKQVAAGKSDGEMLAWMEKNSKTKPSLADIEAWSAQQDRRTPTDVEGREFFNNLHKKIAPQREDISTWFDLLDLDDYVSFGGKA